MGETFMHGGALKKRASGRKEKNLDDKADFSDPDSEFLDVEAADKAAAGNAESIWEDA